MIFRGSPFDPTEEGPNYTKTHDITHSTHSVRSVRWHNSGSYISLRTPIIRVSLSEDSPKSESPKIKSTLFHRTHYKNKREGIEKNIRRGVFKRSIRLDSHRQGRIIYSDRGEKSKRREGRVKEGSFINADR
jgi:hypothetical protein